MLIPIEEYKRDYEAFKKSEFTIPENEVLLVVDSLSIKVSEALPQFCSDYFDPKDLPKINELLVKYGSLNNVGQIKSAIEKFGYSATTVDFRLSDNHTPDTIYFNCRIGRPRKS